MIFSEDEQSNQKRPNTLNVGALVHTLDFQGIIGTLTCDEFGDCGTGRMNIYYHADSSITDVAQLPVEYQFAP